MLWRGAHLGNVWVGHLRFYAVVLDHVLEGVGHKASVAPVVSIILRAVQEVLRAEGRQETCGLLQLSLQSSYGTERPTGTAGTLERQKTCDLTWQLCLKF